MSVKNFFRNLGAQEDIGDRDEDYGDTYSDDDYDSRDRRRSDRRRDADENDEYYEPSRSESRRRPVEEDYGDYYDEPRRPDSRTERRYADSRTARRGEDRYGDRYEDRNDVRNEPDDEYDSNAKYYEPRSGRSWPGASGRRNGTTVRYAAKKEPSVQCFLPSTHMQCRGELVSALKEGNVVVVDVRKLESSAITRLLDFMSGVGQALEADMYRLDDSTMIVLSRVEIELDVNDLQARMEDDEEIDEETDEAVEEELLDDESDDPEIEDDEL